MKLKCLFFLSMQGINFLVADNLHLAPKNFTEEELQAQLQAQEEANALEIARIAQMQSNVVNFVQALHCDQTAIDYISSYIDDESLWDIWIPIAHSPENIDVLDKINIIHFVVINGKTEQLTFLCKKLREINRLDLLNTPTQIRNLVPISFCIYYASWNCLTKLLEYGAYIDVLSTLNSLSTNPEQLKLCKNAIDQGLMLYRQYLAEQKMKTKKKEAKIRKKIQKLEQKAFKKLEDFAYGIDSDSDSN